MARQQVQESPAFVSSERRPHLIVHRARIPHSIAHVGRHVHLTGTIIETGTESYRLAHTQARQIAQNGRAQLKRPAERPGSADGGPESERHADRASPASEQTVKA